MFSTDSWQPKHRCRRIDAHSLTDITIWRLCWSTAKKVQCPELTLRDPDRSVLLARKAVDWGPRQERHWSTLGMAYYRAADPRAALGALNQASRLRGSRDLADSFFLAMVHWRLGEKGQARQ